jgi:hypothetical protein
LISLYRIKLTYCQLTRNPQQKQKKAKVFFKVCKLKELRKCWNKATKQSRTISWKILRILFNFAFRFFIRHKVISKENGMKLLLERGKFLLLFCYIGILMWPRVAFVFHGERQDQISIHSEIYCMKQLDDFHEMRH